MHKAPPLLPHTPLVPMLADALLHPSRYGSRRWSMGRLFLTGGQYAEYDESDESPFLRDLAGWK